LAYDVETESKLKAEFNIYYYNLHLNIVVVVTAAAAEEEWKQNFWEGKKMLVRV
jgi:hypothetical protein